MPKYSPFFVSVHININYVIKYYHHDYFDQTNKQTNKWNPVEDQQERKTEPYCKAEIIHGRF